MAAPRVLDYTVVYLMVDRLTSEYGVLYDSHACWVRQGAAYAMFKRLRNLGEGGPRARGGWLYG